MQQPRSRPLAAVLAPLLAATAFPAGNVIPPLAREVEWIPAEQLSPAATVEITARGRISGGGQVRYDPQVGAERDEPFGRVHAWLAEIGKGMSRTPLEGDLLAADDPLLVRADRDTPFHYVLKVMEQCSRPDVLIPHVLFEVDTPVDLEPPEGTAAGAVTTVDARIPPVPPQLVDGELVEQPELRVVVAQEGEKVRADDPALEWDGSEDTPWRYDPHTRVVEYRLGPVKTRSLDEVEQRLRRLREYDPAVPLSIRTDPGVLLAEIVAAMDAARRAGYRDLSFHASAE